MILTFKCHLTNPLTKKERERVRERRRRREREREERETVHIWVIRGNFIR